MSFDSEFNYTAGKAAITAKIASNAAQVSIIEAQITALTNANAPEDVIYNKMIEKMSYKADTCGLESLASEIAVVESLSAGSKTILYNFWLALANNKTRFMSEICYNHVAMVADTNVVNLSNDNVLTAPQKKAQGEAIMLNYPICYYNYEMLF